MNPAPRVFWYPLQKRYILFTPDTLAHIYEYQQKWPWSREAGGELFTPDPKANGLVIVAASGPSRKDTRKRYYFNQDPQTATRERERQYKQGLHAVGLWHTHPQENPTPSWQDKKTAKQYFDDFEGARNSYLLVVMGKNEPVPNMSVWSIETKGWVELIE